MTIEKEALEIVRRGGSDQFPDPGTAVYIIGKALQKKQDRIEELERSCGLLGLEKNACERKIKDLESALKDAMDYIPDKKLFERANKAIGGGK